MDYLSSLKSNYERFGYLNLDFCDSARMQNLKSEVDNLIEETFFISKEWEFMHTKDFHKYAYDCQVKINKLDYQKIVLEENYEMISYITGMKNICHESVVFLRAVRPNKKTKSNDNIGFHRETMYSDSPQQTARAHNMWIPLTIPTEETAVRYFPTSHLIPDELLSWNVDETPNSITKGSYGHKLGSAYKPKSITKGLENLDEFKMLPTLNQFALFSAMTVHGAGVNNSDKIRLSLSMAMIDSNQITYNKPYTAANGRPHYSKLN